MRNAHFISRKGGLRLRIAVLALVAAAGVATDPAEALQRPQIGLSPAFAQLHQEEGGNPNSPGAADYFGLAVAAGDFNGDGIDDLAIGVSGENHDLSAHPNTGAVAVLIGRPQGGLLGTVARRLRPRGGDPNLPYPMWDPAGMIPDHRGGEPFWGFALATGDFDGNGFADLAVGAANRDALDPVTLADAGAVAVIFARLFADGFETADPGEWSAVAP